MALAVTLITRIGSSTSPFKALDAEVSSSTREVSVHSLPVLYSRLSPMITGLRRTWQNVRFGLVCPSTISLTTTTRRTIIATEPMFIRAPISCGNAASCAARHWNWHTTCRTLGNGRWRCRTWNFSCGRTIPSLFLTSIFGTWNWARAVSTTPYRRPTPWDWILVSNVKYANQELKIVSDSGFKSL